MECISTYDGLWYIIMYNENGLALEDGLNINVRDVYMLNYGKSVILIECLK